MGLAFSTAPLSGMEAALVTLRCTSQRLPNFTIVGCRKLKLRKAKTAFAPHCKLPFDFRHAASPSTLLPRLPKSGRFDLPIALGILAATGQILPTNLQITSMPVSLRYRRAAPDTRRAGDDVRAVAADELYTTASQCAEAALLKMQPYTLRKRYYRWAHLAGRESIAPISASRNLSVRTTRYERSEGQAQVKRAWNRCCGGTAY